MVERTKWVRGGCAVGVRWVLWRWVVGGCHGRVVFMVVGVAVGVGVVVTAGDVVGGIYIQF